ncbi:Antibiotic biosynthesis monooxygenase [Tolumonas auensis DSM 9187]|uniref:Antibiotic biosynthesis monooxygenase n=1 Tax=Tolumonas auensis (strain DSM 9187 / NBRC 110442 / TA 4) TaxID=595494 RepID=C4LEU9_TOLAT|nr:putative quinol monooxygenase [Tolumonas auensis]ACQ93116.1 Antibiotic biosynthesis monooxygenase [Tolumonas auensis DSM 9187]
MTTLHSETRHIVCTVHAQTAYREQVKQLLFELVQPARDEKSCLYYDLNQDIKNPDFFYIMDGWVSDEAIAAHMAHPNVPRVVEQLKPLLAEPLSLSISHRISAGTSCGG